MKLSTVALCIFTLGACFGAVAKTIPYSTLVQYAKNDSEAPGATGKTVQVDIVGKGEVGYFANKYDQTTFVCDSGDKVLASHKKAKGLIEGTIATSQYWEGSTVYSLKNCQFVKPSSPNAITGVALPTAAKKRVYEIGGKGWGGVVEITDDERSSKVEMETGNERGATCTVAGTASPNSSSKSLFKASDASECTAELLFAGDTVKVKSHGCQDYCGAAAPGFDYMYKLKR